MSRRLVTLIVCTLGAILSLGALAARPAFAAVTINSITISPNPIPAIGGAYPVFIDCTNDASALPTGTATLTDSRGVVISQNGLAFFNFDSSGNPVLYTYLVFQPDTQPTGNVTTTISVAVTDQGGATTTGSTTVQQGHDVPITIVSLSATLNTQSSGSTASVSAALSYSGANQAGFYDGVVTLANSSGTALDIEPLFGPNGTDGQGNPLFYSTVSNIPANTTSSPEVYTINLLVKDNSGNTNTATTSVTVAPTGGAAATALAPANANALAGTPVTLSAGLTNASGSAAIANKTVAFQVDGNTVGTATTDGNGVANLTYNTPSTARLGAHVLVASFAGDSQDQPSSGTGTLSVASNVSLSGQNISGTYFQTLTLNATLLQASDSAPLAGEPVTFQINGVPVGTGTTNSAGVAALAYTVSTSLNTGSNAVTVSYPGDTGTSAATGSATLNVSQAAVGIYVMNRSGAHGGTVSLQVTLRRLADKVLLTNTPVTYEIDGQTLVTLSTNANGVNHHRYVIPASLSVGNHTITAVYAGDAYTAGGSQSATLTVTN